MFYSDINFNNIDKIYIKNRNYPEMNIIYTYCNIPNIVTKKINKSVGSLGIKNIKDHTNFKEFCQIAQKIQFNFNFDKNELKNMSYDLGIHIRLTDMNKHHGNLYGYIYYDDFEKNIINYIKSNNVNKVFLTSDNVESLDEVKKLLKSYNVCVYKNNNKMLSLKSDNSNFCQDQKNILLKNTDTYKEVMKDVYHLSLCENIIYRTSGVSGLAILLSSKK